MNIILQIEKKTVLLVLLALSCLMGSRLTAQDQDLIARGEITVKGITLDITPKNQTVPVNTQTSVNTVFSVENAELLAGMEVKGTLKGPGINGSITLTTLPNHAFAIPGFPSKGTYILENIRLEADGNFLLASETPAATIEVLDIVVTRVETRPLTLEEIREKGIDITNKNFTVYNFSVGILVESQEVHYEFPVVYAGQQPYIPQQGGFVEFTDLKGPVSNEKVPFMLELPELELPQFNEGGAEAPPKIPGVLIFNNDIAFLNQFFSVMFIISNNAPDGSPLALKDLTASIQFPDGLREAETNPPHVLGAPIPVRCPGPDGKIGTADDLDIILATFSGMAEFLAEGLKEGTHIVNVNFSGTLSGLPLGDTPVKGSASGAVMVRNPEFSITFAHPGVVRIGEEYDIYVNITNTSPVTANLASFTMPPSQLVGTKLLSDQTASFESIAPGESVSAQFRMQSLTTGRVRATAIEIDGNAQGQFILTAGVGEKGIPLSPDTLVLPDFAYELPQDIVNTALVALGEAYSIATTPPGGLPQGVPPIGTDVVENRVIDLAEAGQRVFYYNDDSTAEINTLRSIQILALDWLGNRDPDISFDILRRLTSKGVTFAEAQAAVFNTGLQGKSAAEFQEAFAESCSYKNPFISAALSFDGGRSARLSITDFYQNRMAHTGFHLIRNIPYGDYFLLTKESQVAVDFAVVGHLDPNGYTVEVLGSEEGTFNLSLIVPADGGGLNRVTFTGIPCEPGSRSHLSMGGENGYTAFTLTTEGIDGGPRSDTGIIQAVQEPALQLLSAAQDCTADPTGHVVALLFNRTVTKDTAQAPANYSIEGKEVYASFLQPSGRVVLVGFNSTISPLVESSIRVENLEDTLGRVMSPSPVEMPVKATIKTPGGIVFGRVSTAEGRPVSDTTVRLEEYEDGETSGYGDSTTTYSFTQTDTAGNYQFDFVRIMAKNFLVEVTDPATGKRERMNAKIHVNGQRLQLDIIMRGRGSVTGVVLQPDGSPAVDAHVQATAQNAGIGEYYTAQTDETGAFTISDIPLGLVSLSAVLGSWQGSAGTSLDSPGAANSVTIQFTAQPLGTVNGRVFSSDGITPAADTVVSLEKEGLFLGNTRTDSQGFFQFANVPVGTVTLKAVNPLTLRFEGTVSGQVTDGQVFTANIIFRGAGKISGQVSSHDGSPRQGVVVFIPNTPFYTETDAAGTFILEEIPVGTYTIQAYDKTTYEQTGGPVTIHYEGEQSHIDLVFAHQQKGAVTGTILNVDGTPLPDVDVLVSDGNYIVVATTRSDTYGNYYVEDLNTGNYKVTVVKGGYAGISDVTINTPLPAAQCNVQLRGKGRIVVDVLGSDGQSGVMADVTLNHSLFQFKPGSYIGFRGTDSTFTTDENGHLVLDDIFTGSFSVTARNAFYPQGAYKKDALTADGEEKSIQLTMQGTGTITVTVMSIDGVTPVGNAPLTFTPNGQPPRRDIFTHNDPVGDPDNVGKYTFTLVPPGSFYIEAEDPVNGYVGDYRGFLGYDLPENGEMNVTLVLKGKGTVKVAVKDFEGTVINPLSGSVTLKNIGYPHHTVSSTDDNTPVYVDGNGRFVFSNIFEGDFSVSAYDHSINVGGRANGTVSGSGQEVLVDVILDAWGTLSGRILTPDSSGTVPNTRVVLYSQVSGEAVGYTTSSAGGSFSFQYVPLGSYRLEVFDPASGRHGKAYATLTSGGETSQQDVRLEGRGNVSGTFFDGSGITPIPNATVTLTDQSTAGFTVSTITGPEGNFHFENIGEGNFTLQATDPDSGLSTDAAGVVEYDGHHVFVNLYGKPTGTVTGVVLASNGSTPIGGAGIVLSRGALTFPTSSSPDGSYIIRYVPLGGVSLNAVFDRDSGTADGILEYHGQELQLDVTLMGLGTVTGTLRDADDNPVVGETVKLTSNYETFFQPTGVDGSFTFENIRMGVFSVEVAVGTPGTLDYRAASSSGELVSNPDQTPTAHVALSLEAAGTVQGTVFYSDGVTPAANALAALKRGGAGTLYATAGQDGSFTFEAVKTGDFTLDIQGDNNGGKARVYGQLTANGDIVSLDNLTLDNTLPEVEVISPSSGSNAIPLSTQFTVTFTESMDPASINGTSIRLSSAQGLVGSTVELQPDNKTVTVTPGALASFMLYTLTITTAVEDAAGNKPAAPFSGTFTTLDNMAPAVTGIIPASGTAQAALNSTVSVTFNEPVNDTAFIDDQCLRVSRSGVEPVSGTVTFNENKTTAVLTFPQGALQPDSTYTIEVNGQKDALNNTQTVPFSSSFSTIDTQAPQLTGLTASLTTLVEGSPVTVTAATAATDVAGVHFFVNGQLKTTVTTGANGNYPYQFNAPYLSDINGSTVVVEARAVDTAGNLGNTLNLTLTLLSDSPPTVTLTGPAGADVFPGDTVQFTVSAADDVQLADVTFKAVGDTVNDVISQPLSAATYTNTFSVTVPLATLPETIINVNAEATDSRGNTTNADTIVLQVPLDAQDPVVTISSPAPGDRFKYNDTVNIEAQASDDIGLKEVRIYLDDQELTTFTNPGSPFTAVYGHPAPSLEQEQQSVIRVEAEDLSGKITSDTVTVIFEQLIDATAPVVHIATPTHGSLVFPGENLTIRAAATDDVENGVSQVEFYIDDQLIATDTEAPYEAAYTIPADTAAGTTLTLKAVATDLDSKTGQDLAILEALTGSELPGGSVIQANDSSYDNQVIIIRSGTVEINGAHTFQHILVKETGHLSHSSSDSQNTNRMELSVTGKVVIGPLGRIDVGGQGYLGGYSGDNANPTGLTLDNAAGSDTYAGGSFGGYGGSWGSNVPNEPYGSLYDPSHPGSGGGGYGGSYIGGNGAGVIRIDAAEVIADGQIASNGANAGESAGGGSGGSIRIEAASIKGSGSITANGGSSVNNGAGGGGRIALYYSTLTIDTQSIYTYGGKQTNSSDFKPERNGSAGTLYLKKSGETGQLIVKNDPDIETVKGTLLTEGVPGTITQLTGDTLTDAAASFVPNSLSGKQLIILPNSLIQDPAAFTIVSNLETSITVETSGTLLTDVANVGDQYRVKRGTHVVMENSLNHVSGSAAVTSLTMENAILVIDGTLEADRLNIWNGSKVTHSPTVLGTTYSLRITAGEINIDESSGIDADGMGYPGAFQQDRGNGTGVTGVTYPNTTELGSVNYCGGSYGGYSGVRWSSNWTNMPYGSFTHPATPGSGGGGENTSYHGTSGGGVIAIEAGTLTLYGAITADGTSETGWGGTGSGGSIHISVGTLSGTGSIGADGGSSYQECGAGSGGRIAVYYDTADQFNLSSITSYGGTSGSGADEKRNASAGTVYLEQNGQPGRLMVDNRGQHSHNALIFPKVVPAQADSVTTVNTGSDTLVDQDGGFMPGSLMGMKLTVAYDDGTGTSESTYTIIANSTDSITVDGGGMQAGTYRVTAVADARVFIRNTPLAQVSGDWEVGDLTLETNSSLSHTDCTLNSTDHLAITASGKVTVDSSSSIDVTDRGYLGGYRAPAADYGSPAEQEYGRTVGNVPGSQKRHGASHGGKGGEIGTYIADTPYGSLFYPAYPGSGGGGFDATIPGANGGGVIHITAPQLEVNGKIYANGGNRPGVLVNGHEVYCGGAGGSILLETDTLTGTGEIAANGSYGHYYTGGGGGGRIAIYYDSTTSQLGQLTTTAYGGLEKYYTSDIMNGGAGTIFLIDTTQSSGSLIVDNNSMPTTENSTPLPSVKTGDAQQFYTSLGENWLEDTNVSWIAGSLAGIKLNPDAAGSATDRFTIVSNEGQKLFTDLTDGLMTAFPVSGGSYTGELHLLDLTVRNGGKLFTYDLIQVSGTLTVDATSTLKAANYPGN